MTEGDGDWQAAGYICSRLYCTCQGDVQHHVSLQHTIGQIQDQTCLPWFLARSEHLQLGVILGQVYVYVYVLYRPMVECHESVNCGCS